MLDIDGNQIYDTITGSTVMGIEIYKPRPYKILADVRKLTEEQWLQFRGLGIGGSDSGAALRLNPYKSQLNLYLEKISETKSKFENIHTRFGKKMEPVIREWFKEEYELQENKHIEVFEYPYMMQCIEYPFMLANIDGIIEHEEYGPGIIEIKTASEMTKKHWKDEEIPDTYYCQIQHYLAVTGHKYCMIIAMIGKELIWKYVPRNEAFISQLIETEKTFWEENILKKIPPAPEGTEDSKDALAKLYGIEDKDKIIELHDMESDRLKYKELDKQIKELQKEQEEIKQRFMFRMGNAEIALIGEKKATWKTVIKKAYEVKESQTRQFRLS